MSLILKNFGKSQMYLLKGDPGISTKLKGSRWKSREAEFMYVLMSELKKGDVFFDLGANLGYNTVRASEILGKDGQYVAIEPDPKNYGVLKKNIELNGLKNAVVLHAAILNKTTKVDFFRTKQSNLGSVYHYRKSRKGADKVQAYSMKDLIKTTGKTPTFCKMDIEGGEVDALGGIADAFRGNNNPLKILLEVHQTIYDSKGLKLAPVIQDLYDIGFYPKYVASAAIIQPTQFKQAGYSPVKCFGHRGVYVGVSKEHAKDWASYIHKDTMSTGRVTKRIVRSVMLERK